MLDDSRKRDFTSRRNAGNSMKTQNVYIPNRWLKCPRKSAVIANKFVVCKTMLDERYDGQVPEESRFNWKILRTARYGPQKLKIGLVIDLTNTDRYYDKRKIEEDGCDYIKLSCKGFEEAPTSEATYEFAVYVRMFLSRHPDSIVCVHCTNGFNRSGFMLVSFLCGEMKWDLHTACAAFAQARNPGIFDEEYLIELSKRWGKACDKPLMVPNLPNYYEDDRKMKKNVIAKETKFMDGMVSNVDNVMDVNLIQEIQSIVTRMCGQSRRGREFPGSQPVNIDQINIRLLTEKQYGVTWKADGQRYLMLIRGKNEIYMLDRDFAVYKVNGMFIPRKKALNEHITDTLLDGEMVIDKLPDGTARGRYLIYDVIRFEGQEVGKTIFNTRLKCINLEIIGPRNNLTQLGLLDRDKEPFSLRAKEYWDLTKAHEILDGEFSKQLLHKTDGLIFQPFDEIYVFGQCPGILKWKSPEHNSIDFRLSIGKENTSGMIGNLHLGGLKCNYSTIEVTQELSHCDNKIIECTWDYQTSAWKFLRERTDKSFPNSHATAQSILKTIMNPVTKDFLYDVIDNCRFSLNKNTTTGNDANANSNGSLSAENVSNTSSSNTALDPSLLRSERKRSAADYDPLGLMEEHSENMRLRQLDTTSNCPPSKRRRLH